MRIANNGKVGIGAPSPGYSLDINNNETGDWAMHLGGDLDADGRWTGILMGYHSSTSYNKAGIVFKAYDATSVRGDLHFCIDNTNDNGNVTDTEVAMTVYRDKNIGIGTTTPTSGQLHIVQTATTGSGLYIFRALASGSTDSPLVNIRNNTDGDDQPVMRLDQRASNATVLELHHNEDDGNASDTIIDFDFTDDADVDGAFFCKFQDSSGTIGSITANGASAVAFNTSSDYRLKEDLKSISDAISTVNELRTYDFKWKKDGKRRDGLIAHEVQDILPYAVSGEKDAVTTKKYKDGVDSDGEDIWKEKEVIAPQGIDYGALVPVLIKAVQELSAKVEALENK